MILLHFQLNGKRSIQIIGGKISLKTEMTAFRAIHRKGGGQDLGTLGTSKLCRVYYPPDVSSMKYCCLGVFRKEYFRLVTR